MILFEFEGKEILKKYGINIPKSQLLSSPNEKCIIKQPLVIKAQVLSGKRADVGGIEIVKDGENPNLFGKTINNELVEKVLVEELVDFEGGEYYVSLTYDTETRGPVLSISESGGTGIEQREVKKYPLNPLNWQRDLDNIESAIPQELLTKITQAFFDEDCLLLEINPLVKTKNGWFALDAKVKLDDVAKKRHEDWSYPPRSVPGYSPTTGEIAAKKIDEQDYRGTAGSSYFDLDGDIAVLSSGGGVSLTALDSLIASGGKPANFTEYSGNPPKEKVVKLTKIVLNKPNIHGLWVIGTVVANFTDIYETLTGLIDGLKEAEKDLGKKFDFPIVIRRGGPRDEEAFEMLRGIKDFNLILQGPETSIAKSAEVMAQKAKEYAQK
jgi:citryl-CoA synthetase large subunit